MMLRVGMIANGRDEGTDHPFVLFMPESRNKVE